MSDDYESAYLQRALDQRVLSQSNRRTAAMHLGGVVIECRLKAKILNHFPEPQREWRNRSTHGCGVANPKHDLAQALTLLLKLPGIVFLDGIEETNIRSLLEKIQRPNGCEFIALRYSGVDPSDSEYEEWMDAYKKLNQWLNTQFS